MNPLARWRERRRVDRELPAEMAAHLAEQIDELREEGHSEEEARSLARQHFGNLTLLQQNSREEWGWNSLTQILQDLRYGWRLLRQTPGFTTTAILVLALGIGMNTAMFSAVKAVLLSALPYPEPDRLIELWQTNKAGGKMSVSRPDFSDWRVQTQTFENLAVYGGGTATLAGSFEARQVRMAPVGRGFFEIVGTSAVIGRTFSLEDQKPGGTPTLVFDYSLAVQLWGEAPAAVGKTVRLNGMAFTVIGVMPPNFAFPNHTQLWLPNDLFPDVTARSAHNYHVIGRLKRGVTRQQAQADMDLVAARLSRQYADDKDDGIRLVPLHEELVGDIRPALITLECAVMLVLLIACVNLSSLQLARASARVKELGLRSALGAGRGRLIRQLLTESVLLSGAGGLAGLTLAELGVVVLRKSAPPNLPGVATLNIDLAVLCFTAVISLVAGLLFGILPALQSSRVDVNEAIKEGAGKGLAVRHMRWGQMLVAGQIALAMILLSGAALLIKSYWKLSRESTGLQTGSVQVSDITWPASADGNSVDGALVQKAGRQMIRQIGSLPGVTAVALVHGLPFEDASDGNFEIQGRPLPADPHLYPDAFYRLATADYFQAFGLPMLKGRGFTAADDEAAVFSQPKTQHDRAPADRNQVAIVNQAFEREFFPGGTALNQRIRFLGMELHPQFMTIIGVVPDVRALALSKPAASEVYVSYFQHADSAMDAALVVRGPAAIDSAAKRIITALNHDTAVQFHEMDSLILGTVARERFQTALLALFAGCALLLAVVGVYGLLSYVVARRMSEIGIRMALGANRRAIQQLILGQGGILILTGVLLGLAGAVAVSRFLRSMLYQVTTTDPAALSAVVIAFALAAMMACYLPARRASRVDPAIALRRET